MMQSIRDTTRCSRSWLRYAAVWCAGVTLLSSVGCRQGPITENDERSPYDRYNLIRDEYAPAYLQDEYGRKRPNLRGRLIDRR